jgi:hypothetical protein
MLRSHLSARRPYVSLVVDATCLGIFGQILHLNSFLTQKTREEGFSPQLEIDGMKRPSLDKGLPSSLNMYPSVACLVLDHHLLTKDTRGSFQIVEQLFVIQNWLQFR